MEEAEAVIARLERIEALKRAGASPLEILIELRALLRCAEVWLAAEHAGQQTERAARAVERCWARLHDSENSRAERVLLPSGRRTT